MAEAQNKEEELENDRFNKSSSKWICWSWYLVDRIAYGFANAGFGLYHYLYNN